LRTKADSDTVVVVIGLSGLLFRSNKFDYEVSNTLRRLLPFL